LFIEVPVHNARRRRRPRNAKRREKYRKRREKYRKRREEKKSKEDSPPSPFPDEQPALAQPDSPIGWFDTTILQLDGCGSVANCSCSPARSSRSPPASSLSPAESSRSPAMSSSRPVVSTHSPIASSLAVSSPAASIPRPAAIGSRSPAVRGGHSPATNSLCPAVSEDDEVCDVESSNDGTSDKERKKNEKALYFHEEWMKSRYEIWVRSFYNDLTEIQIQEKLQAFNNERNNC